MANLGIDTYSGLCSYILFRHTGAGSPDGILALPAAYVPAAPLVFKDDRAAAETPPRAYPKTGGFTCTGFQFINDSGATIFFSLDGVQDHFAMLAGENILFDKIHVRQMWLRGTAGGESFRLVVW